jgi:tetratricopeptide (TPR) repeat protein
LRGQHHFEHALTTAQETTPDLLPYAFYLIAEVYNNIGQPQEALRLYQLALPLMREVGGRSGEATTLNNLALVYNDIGQPQEALRLFEQALPVLREVGDRAKEAITLNNLAYLYQDVQRYEEALVAFEASITLAHKVSYPAREVAGLVGLAVLLYRHLNRSTDAIAHLEQALMLLRTTDLPQDAAGQTVEQIQMYLDIMRKGESF